MTVPLLRYAPGTGYHPTIHYSQPLTSSTIQKPTTIPTLYPTPPHTALSYLAPPIIQYTQPPTIIPISLHSTTYHHPLHFVTIPTINHLPPPIIHYTQPSTTIPYTLPPHLHSYHHPPHRTTYHQYILPPSHHPYTLPLPTIYCTLPPTTIHNPINSTNCHNSLHFGTTPTLNQLPQSTTLKHLPPLPSSSTTIHCTQPLATSPTLCHHLHSTTYHHPLHSTTSPPSFSLHHLPLIIHNTKPYTTIPYTIYRPPLSHHLYTQPLTTIPNSQPLAIIPPSPHSATYYYPTMAQMVRAFGMNLKVGGSSPPQVETLSVSKTLILSREHPFMCLKLMLLPTHS